MITRSTTSDQIRTLDDLPLARRARFLSRRLQRAARWRAHHRRHAHRGDAADAAPPPRRRRRHRHRQPPRPSEGRAEIEVLARTDPRKTGGAARRRRAVGGRLRRRRCRSEGERAEARRSAAAREPPLPRRRGKERSRRSPSSFASSPTTTSTTPSAPAIARTRRSTRCRACSTSDRTAGGLLLAKEIEFLQKITNVSDRPFVALLGGAKIAGKIEPLEALVKLADTVLIGGGMANTFLAARGVAMGGSLVDNDSIEIAKRITKRDAAGRSRRRRRSSRIRRRSRPSTSRTD